MGMAPRKSMSCECLALEGYNRVQQQQFTGKACLPLCVSSHLLPFKLSSRQMWVLGPALVQEEAFFVAEVTKMKETLFIEGFMILKSAHIEKQSDQGRPGGATQPLVMQLLCSRIKVCLCHASIPLLKLISSYNKQDLARASRQTLLPSRDLVVAHKCPHLSGGTHPCNMAPGCKRPTGGNL